MTKEQLIAAIEIGHAHFAEMLRFSNTDETIRLTIRTFPSNTDLHHVTIKAVIINALYGTVIYDVPRIAHHIAGLAVDQKLAAADLSLIDDIRTGHGIGTDSKERNLYSFSTKYVHFHRPDVFPLFDNLVKELLPAINAAVAFRSRFTQKQLLTYQTYKETIDALMRFLDVASWGYKRFDEGLWVIARYKREHNFDQTRMPQVVFTQLRQTIGDIGEQRH